MKFNLDRAAIGAMLKDEKVRAELQRRADLILASINHEGYEAVSSIGRTRARAAVVARSTYARRSNAIHNTLVRHIGAGRD